MVKKMTWAVRTPQICLGFVLLVIGYVMFAMMNFSVFDAIKGPVELTAVSYTHLTLPTIRLV